MMTIHIPSNWRNGLLSSVAVLILLTSLRDSSAAAAESPTAMKSESFDKDPGWEGHNNHVVPTKALIVKQDFGYSDTNLAGKAKGEMGGVVQRSTTPASYAARISTVTLDE